MIVPDDCFTWTYKIKPRTKIRPLMLHLLIKYWGNVIVIDIIITMKKKLSTKRF